MTPTREELAAFADGELPEARAAEIALLIESDPELTRQLAAHRRVKAMLTEHYAPVLDQPVPEHLIALLKPENKVVDFAAAREKREERRQLPRWSWVAGPALAASLALALILPRGEEMPGGYAGTELASVLDNRLVAEQNPQAATRVLLSFRDSEGEYCRAFAGEAQSGIACRDAQGWRFEALGGPGAAAETEYRQAGATAAELMAQAQEMAAAGALDAEAEAAAREKGWRKEP